MISYAKSVLRVTKRAFLNGFPNSNIKNHVFEKGEKMKKLVSAFLSLCLVFAFGTTSFADGISVTAKSAILVERSTGRVLFEYEADKQMPPASITKIMTLLLVMEAIENGKFSFETEVDRKSVV